MISQSSFAHFPGLLMEISEQLHVLSTKIENCGNSITVAVRWAQDYKLNAYDDKQETVLQSSLVDLMPEDVFCVCRQGAQGTMIECESDNCAVGWYHTSCIGMKNIPVGKWICPACRK